MPRMFNLFSARAPADASGADAQNYGRPMMCLIGPPGTREQIAEKLCAAMWGGPGNAYRDDPAFKAEFERAADLVLTWLAAAREQG